jgi:histidine triad (HIT) family protein
MRRQRQMSDCLFCKIVNKEIPAEIVYEDDLVLAFKDINPQAPQHLLIIPKKHIDKVSNLKKQEGDLISRMVLKANEIADLQGLADEGYRLVINCGKNAGQEVFHLHLHLLGGRKFTWPPG